MNNSIPTEEFNSHWKTSGTLDLPKLKVEEACNFLMTILEQGTDPAKQVRILDCGSGDGVHAVAFQELSKLGKIANSNYLGVDISDAAVAKANGLKLDAVEFRIADIQDLPFPNDSFDLVFSFGVLGYTRSPRQAFHEMARVTKPGGLIGLWLFPKDYGLRGLGLGVIRSIIRLSGPWLAHIIANLLVPFMYILPSRSKLTLSNASWGQCREVLMVTIAPRQLDFPTETEIEDWFKQSNIEILYDDIENPKTLVGRKR